ncbi:MAG: dihydroorotase [Legionellaceae bacterium]|nr:dihydroorotase [Legionellaceae bacterium]
MRILSILRPDDWHVHLRDNEALKHTVSATAAHFARALVMPNLTPALTTLASILAYRKRILSSLDKSNSFEPYMTFYLNETVDPNDLINAKQYSYILGAKLYPAGATTNSAQGVTSIRALYPHFEMMQMHDLVLQIHGEVTHGDIFAREALFIKTHLASIVRDFPRLRIVLEHISTQTAVEFVSQASPYVAATITPQHLLFNRNELLAGGLKPHYYCLPILKREKDQLSLQRAAVSGNSKFFAGTDSAPHAQSQKENACGCAGVYSAPYALAMYTEIFDKLDQLPKLEAFTSRFGAEFYQLPAQSNHIELIKQAQVIPMSLPVGDFQVVPLAAGSTLTWSIHAPIE